MELYPPDNQGRPQQYPVRPPPPPMYSYVPYPVLQPFPNTLVQQPTTFQAPMTSPALFIRPPPMLQLPVMPQMSQMSVMPAMIRPAFTYPAQVVQPQPSFAIENVKVEEALKSAKKWGRIIFIVSLLLILLGSYYMISGFMLYVSLRMFHGLSDALSQLPIKIDLNESLVGIELIIAAMLGIGLIVQGGTGVRNCEVHTMSRAKRHIARAKKCLVFFSVVFVVKFFVDIKLLTDLSKSLESQLHKVPELVKQHNEVSNGPHIVLVYKNNTVLFGNDSTIKKTKDEDYLQAKPEPNCEDNSENCVHYNPKFDKRENDKRRRGRAQSYYIYHVSNLIRYDSRTNVMVIRMDQIEGHIKQILIIFYCVVAGIELLVLIGICACIMGCNDRYKGAFHNLEYAQSQLPPPTNDNNTELELVSLSSDR